MLAAAGYAYTAGPSTNPEWRDAAGRQVDLHPVAFTELRDRFGVALPPEAS